MLPLPPKAQIQAIAERLHGHPVQLESAEFTQPWKTCWQALDGVEPGLELHHLSYAVLVFPDHDQILDRILDYTYRPAGSAGVSATNLPPASSRLPHLPAPAGVDWIWPGWVPRRGLTLLCGLPGVGKSFFALDLARSIIHGLQLPDRQVFSPPGGNVLWVDGLDDTPLMSERAYAWQMDATRLHLIVPGGAGTQRQELIDLNLPDQRARLVQAVQALSPELVVVHPLCMVSSQGEDSLAHVLSILAFLSLVAHEFNTGMLVTYNYPIRGLYRSLQQLAAAHARYAPSPEVIPYSVLRLDWISKTGDFWQNGPRRLERAHSNLGGLPHPLDFSFIPAPAGPTGSVALHWTPSKKE